MVALDLIGLQPLMERTQGVAEIVIGLIDGPVAIDHPDLARDRIRALTANQGNCSLANSVACQHGTFVAGILSARRGSVAPAICPGCTLLVRPIFAEATQPHQLLPEATPDELARAILECVNAGATVLNLSVALARPSSTALRALEDALNECARRNVIVAAAAGNQGVVGSSPITRHSWVLPVVACDLKGQPLDQSNLGLSIGRRGLRAPGAEVTSLASNGQARMLAGTSVAAPFVTGAAALLWSQFPKASASQIKLALAGAGRRNTVAPPLLNAWSAFQTLMQF